jgi:hypothetical protein
MPPLPVTDLRRNRATWAVARAVLPAVGAAMTAALPAEPFDRDFRGQRLITTYLDTPRLALRRARARGARYLTLRVRHYHPSGLFALSAKTEAAKLRVEVEPAAARAILAGDRDALAARLPGDVLARLAELAGDDELMPVAEVCCHRFAREDGRDRLTLDAGVRTDTGLALPFAVLEFKSADPKSPPPPFAAALGLRPAKVSKFLWSTGGGH